MQINSDDIYAEDRLNLFQHRSQKMAGRSPYAHIKEIEEKLWGGRSVEILDSEFLNQEKDFNPDDSFFRFGVNSLSHRHMIVSKSLVSKAAAAISKAAKKMAKAAKKAAEAAKKAAKKAAEAVKNHVKSEVHSYKQAAEEIKKIEEKLPAPTVAVGEWAQEHPVAATVIVVSAVAIATGFFAVGATGATSALIGLTEAENSNEDEKKDLPKSTSSTKSSSPPSNPTTPSPSIPSPIDSSRNTFSTSTNSTVSSPLNSGHTAPEHLSSTINPTTISSVSPPEPSLIGSYPRSSAPTSFTTPQPSTHSALPVPNHNLQSISGHPVSFQSPYSPHLSPATTTSIPHSYNMFPIPRISDPVPQTTEARPVQARKSTIEHPVDFSLGMAKGLLKGGYVGIKEFGPGLISAVQVLSQATWDLVTEPVDTISNFNQNVVDCIDYIKSHSTTETLGVVIPEFRELLETWDHIEDGQRGEKAGVIIGKYGVDILICNEAVKGIKAFQELKRTNQLMQFATQALQKGNQAHLNQVGAVLAKEGIPLVERQALLENTILSNEALKKEFAEFVENSKLAVKPNVILPLPGKLSSELNVANIRELIKAGTETPLLAKELGFTNREIAHLTKTGTLDKTVGSAFENIINDKAMLDSLEKFKAAEDFLKPYRGQYLSEIQARELIHQTGIKTYPRPEGIPNHYIIEISKNGAGIKFVDPANPHTYVRIMPGKPHSPFSHQRMPYVNQRVNGKSLDKMGKIVPNDSTEAHIPLEEFRGN